MTERNADQLGEMLSAYLDGELGDADRVRVEQLLDRDPAARRLCEDLQETVATVSSLPRHAAPDSILATVHQQLERRELVGAFDEELDTPAHAPGGGTGRRVARWATAAVVGLAAVGGLWVVIDRYESPGRTNTVVVRAVRKQSADEPGALASKGAAPVRNEVARRGQRGTAPRPAASVSEQESVRTSERMTRPTLDRMSKPETTGFARRRASRNEDHRARGAAAAPSFRTTIAKKIAHGADVVSLRDHTFDAESVRVQIDVATASDRDRIIRALAGNLNERTVPGLGASASVDTDTATRVGANVGIAAETSDGTPPTRFFLIGRSGVNYSDDSRRQLLVRSTIPDVRTLLQAIQISDSNADVSLTVKGARVDGFGDADDIFAQAHVAVQSLGLVPAHLALPAMNLATQAGRGQTVVRNRPADHRTKFQYDALTGQSPDESSLVDRRLKAAQRTKPHATDDASRPMGANYQVVTFVIDVGVRNAAKTTPPSASTRPYPRTKNQNRKPPSKPTPPPK